LNGGALFFDVGFQETVLIEYSNFSLCRAERGGAIYHYSNDRFYSATLSNVRFYGNNATEGIDIFTVSEILIDVVCTDSVILRYSNYIYFYTLCIYKLPI
jgi:hypothetical protein